MQVAALAAVLDGFFQIRRESGVQACDGEGDSLMCDGGFEEDLYGRGRVKAEAEEQPIGIFLDGIVYVDLKSRHNSTSLSFIYHSKLHAQTSTSWTKVRRPYRNLANRSVPLGA